MLRRNEFTQVSFRLKLETRVRRQVSTILDKQHNRMKSPLLLLAWSCFLTLLPWAAKAQSASDAARVIIVFDASGSMAGEVPGGPKIEVAKKVVSDLVSKLDPSVQLGLMAYGHRKKGDCEDIELLVAPASNTREAILSAVAKLQPVGKTPLTSAVMQAAQELRFTEAKASVILVSDGVETCDLDPCAVARELEARGIDFTCHVIGFDIKSGEASSLECMAKQTGGLYMAAKDAASLMESLQKAMMQVLQPATLLVVEPRSSSGGPVIEGVNFELQSGGKSVSKGTGGRWTVELEKAGDFTIHGEKEGKTAELAVTVKTGETLTREMVFTETGIKAVAFDKEGGTAFDKGVAWTLLGPADGDGQRPQTGFSYDAKPFLKVAPGTYLIRAERGSAVAEREVTVGEGAPAEVTLVLGSASLQLSAVATKGGPPIAKDLAWEVLGPADAEGDRKQLGFSYDANPTLTVPAGAWLVRVKHGDATGQQEVQVKAGEPTTVVISLESGKVVASALLEAEGEPIGKDLAWEVFTEANGEGERKQAAFSYDANPTFDLPSGHYLVKVAHGNANAQKDITVTAGETFPLTVVLGAGRLRLAAKPGDGAEALTKDLAWEVFREPNAEGERVSAGFSYEAAPTFSLPAGKYRVVVKWGEASAFKEVTVNAGKLGTDEILLNAGSLAPVAVMAEGADPATKDLFWEVFSEPNAEGERKSVAFSYNGDPRFKLVAGKYNLILKRGAAVATANVEVVANRLTPVTLNLNAGILKLVTSSGTSWKVLGAPDGEGNRKELHFSYDKETTASLPAGKVLIQVFAGEKKAEQETEIQANKLQEVKLEIP